MKEALYLEEDRFKATIHRKLLGTEDEIMTIAQKLEERGTKIGLQRGQEIGMQRGQKIGFQEGEKIGTRKTLENVAFDLLKEGISPTVIEKVTHLPMEKILSFQAT
jgi:hypothetical protein